MLYAGYILQVYIVYFVSAIIIDKTFNYKRIVKQKTFTKLQIISFPLISKCIVQTHITVRCLRIVEG